MLEHGHPVTLPMVKDIRDDFERLLDRYQNFEGVRDSDEKLTLELTGVSFLANEPYILGEPDYDYITREVAWYDSRSTLIADIPGRVPEIWVNIADEHGEVNSNYGNLVFGLENGVENTNQFTCVLQELRNDINSRRAVMIYTRPTMHRDATEGGRDDFVCTNTVQYLIRDNRLQAVVQMRSNDAVFGYRNDYAWQRIVQTRLLLALKSTYPALRMGDMVWQVGSLHIYPRHIPLLEEAIASGHWYISAK